MATQSQDLTPTPVDIKDELSLVVGTTYYLEAGIDSSVFWYEGNTDPTAATPAHYLSSGNWNYHKVTALKLWAWADKGGVVRVSEARVAVLRDVLTAAATAYDVVDASGIAAGDVIRIDDELIRVTAISTDTLTLFRAFDGTTAAVARGGFLRVPCGSGASADRPDQ